MKEAYARMAFALGIAMDAAAFARDGNDTWHVVIGGTLIGIGAIWGWR